MAKKQRSIPATICYSHLGGKLWALMLESLINKGWLARQEGNSKHCYVTEIGKKEFPKLGIDLSQIGEEDI